MRVTKGRIKSKNLDLVKKMYEEVKDNFGFIDMDIVMDMWRILENRETVLKQSLIWKRTLKEYREGKIADIYDAFYARSAYARFLKMMCESPHYPKDDKQNPDFFKKMWELLGELWKRDIPLMKQVLQQAATKGRGTKAMQTRNQAAIDQLGKLVDYGQKVLELLRDPLFAKMFAPPPPPSGKGEDEDDGEGANGSGSGSDGEGDSEDGSGGSSDSEGSGEGGDDEEGGQGQGTQVSSLDKVQTEFKRWIPYMVEGVLFSQDLNMVTKINPKGKWAPTPFPDNSIDVHKIRDSHDLVKLLPGEHALPSDIFYLKYAKRELLCREFMAKQERKQILYILLDVSGSMRGEKVMMVASVVLALLRKVVRNGDHYFLRFFDARPSKLYHAHDVESAQKVAEAVVKNAFMGSDTRIHTALMTAIQDIKEATAKKEMHSQMKDAQILLLTDGEDYYLNPDTINAEKGEIKIHSVVVHCCGEAVSKLSDSYYEIKPGQEREKALDLVQVFDKTKKKRRSEQHGVH